MTVAGGLGPLPTEAKVLHEFIPAEDVVSRVEAVIRIFNRHGNRKNKNKARLKFVLRERGFDWLRDAIEEEYQDILAQWRHRDTGRCAGEFRWFSAGTTTTRIGRTAADLRFFITGFKRLARDQYARAEAAGLRDRHGDGAAGQSDRRSDARAGGHFRTAGDGSLRVTMNQNVVLAYVPAGALKRVYGRIVELGLADDGADEISDVITCPGAYSCNLALTKSMNLGYALRERAEGGERSSGSPAAHQRQRLPELLRPALDRGHRILRQRAQDRGQGSAVLSDAAGRDVRTVRRRDPEPSGEAGAGSRGAGAGALQGEPARRRVVSAPTCCGHKVETFRKLTADLVKPPPSRAGDVSGLGRRRGVFAAARPRRVRGVAPCVSLGLVRKSK